MVYDVRNPAASSDGIIIIGGFIGEIILTLRCFLDYILASPQNQNFVFSVELIEQYLIELLGAEDCHFPNGICSLNISKSLEDIKDGMHLSPAELANIL